MDKVLFLIWYAELFIEGNIMEAIMILGDERMTHKCHLEIHPRILAGCALKSLPCMRMHGRSHVY
jgi:hypothetical protein